MEEGVGQFDVKTFGPLLELKHRFYIDASWIFNCKVDFTAYLRLKQDTALNALPLSQVVWCSSLFPVIQYR